MALRDENDIPLGGSGEVQRTVTPPTVSIVGLALGVISVILCWLFVGGLIAGILGITLSIVGNNKYKTGVGIAGIVISVIGIVLSFIFLIIEMIGLIQLFG